MEKEIPLEIVIEKMDLFALFGESRGLPKEICDKINSFLMAAVERWYNEYKASVNFRCAFCVAYCPAKLLRSKQAVVRQANAKSPKKPRISYVLLMNEHLDLGPYLVALMGRVNGDPNRYEVKRAPRVPTYTAAQMFWEDPTWIARETTENRMNTGWRVISYILGVSGRQGVSQYSR